MKTATGKSPRTRAKIIAELASLPGAIQGKICEDKRRLANGATAVYHNLQYWADGRNHTVRIPRDKLPAFREAVKGGAGTSRADTLRTVPAERFRSEIARSFRCAGTKLKAT